MIGTLEKLCYGGVLNVYIKQCSNLQLIMSRQSGVCRYLKLWLALYESLEYMQLWNQGLWREKRRRIPFGKEMQFWYMRSLKRLLKECAKSKSNVVLLDMKDVLSIKIELDRVKVPGLLNTKKNLKNVMEPLRHFSEDTLYIGNITAFRRMMFANSNHGYYETFIY